MAWEEITARNISKYPEAKKLLPYRDFSDEWPSGTIGVTGSMSIMLTAGNSTFLSASLVLATLGATALTGRETRNKFERKNLARRPFFNSDSQLLYFSNANEGMPDLLCEDLYVFSVSELQESFQELADDFLFEKRELESEVQHEDGSWFRPTTTIREGTHSLTLRDFKRNKATIQITPEKFTFAFGDAVQDFSLPDNPQSTTVSKSSPQKQSRTDVLERSEQVKSEEMAITRKNNSGAAGSGDDGTISPVGDVWNSVHPSGNWVSTYDPLSTAGKAATPERMMGGF